MKIQVQGAIDEEELFQTAYTAQVESRDAILPMQFSAPSGSAAELADKYEIDSSNISESGTYLSQRKPKKEDSITIGSHKRKSSRRSRRKK
jgi:hypothetical protein